VSPELVFHIPPSELHPRLESTSPTRSPCRSKQLLPYTVQLSPLNAYRQVWQRATVTGRGSQLVVRPLESDWCSARRA